MREIKFRAYLKEENTFHNVLNIDFKKQYAILDFGWADKLKTVRYDGLVKFDEIELMQYTGLKDKNGKEIYEGDIIFNKERNTKWVIDTTYKAYELFFYKYRELYYVLDSYEIIGNIHENADLLR